MNLLEAIYHAIYRRRRDRWLSIAQAGEFETGNSPDVPIISVGNITTGGTGKTPAVQWIVRELQARGRRPVVVARGYGGSQSQQGAIVADGTHILLDAHAAGDEPLLHARNLPGVPVVIGRDRVAAVRTAIEKFQPDVIVLDDGFQYWSLPRTFDLVLLDARRPFGNGRLLPVGRLREPPAELRRADAIVLTRADLATPLQLEQARQAIEQWTQAPIWTARHAPWAICDEAQGQASPIEVLSGASVATISALADNAAFIETLKSCACRLGPSLMKSDHHRWNEQEVSAFSQAAGAFFTSANSGRHAIVTTEKDAVKIQPQWTAPWPLWSLVIEMSVEQGGSLLAQIEAKLPPQ
ncbi:MAG: tetraacyldisaccharide 4-kinase [Abditibacteriota bacterium]|nr:tetraacyldisaccharide 4-kinase [Abditibacteriota bacterium]